MTSAFTEWACLYQKRSGGAVVLCQRMQPNPFGMEIMNLNSMNTWNSLAASSPAPQKAVQCRIRAAWKAFWSNKAVLMSPAVGAKRRLQLLRTLVFPVLYFGYSSLVWTPGTTGCARGLCPHVQDGFEIQKKVQTSHGHHFCTAVVDWSASDGMHGLGRPNQLALYAFGNQHLEAVAALPPGTCFSGVPHVAKRSRLLGYANFLHLCH